MNTYLAIITTILVLTQIIRVTQNAMQLRKYNKQIDGKIDAIGDYTKEDVEIQKKAFRYMVRYFDSVYNWCEEESK